MKETTMTTSSKTVLITGGSSGIGLDVARGFLQEGYNVVINGRNEYKLKQAIKTLGIAVSVVFAGGYCGVTLHWHNDPGGA